MTAPPVDSGAGAEAADQILRLGCLGYRGDDLANHARARQLLADQPELSRADIWTAAAVGDAAATAAFLAAEPNLVTRPGGPYAWPPLLYLTYSRIDSDAPGHDPLVAARVLLGHGADPNAGYMWDGICPFTALTGALGGGEDKGNQPPHHQGLALARLLLEAGADPNDSQALYNRQFDADDSHLRLLIEFGLGADQAGPWQVLLGSSQGTPAQLLEDQLSVAASDDRPEWARLALAAGADPDGRGTRHPVRHGLTPYELAVRRGNREVAEVLLAAGATPTPLDPAEQFLSACMAGDQAAVDLQLAARAGLAAEAVARRPDAIRHATELRRPGAVRLLAGLGFDVNAGARTALHQAAYDGDITLIETLLELGADAERRDPTFNANPLGWAEHARQEAAIALLRGRSGPDSAS